MKRHSRTNYTPSSIKGIVEHALARSGLLHACREYDVVRQWPELVGARIAAVTRCDRVENGILYVRVQSAPWRHEMTYMTRDILDTITRKTACTTIRDIVFF